MKDIKIDKDKLPSGIVYLPYLIKTRKTMINNETVWHSNKFINLLLKIKRFFIKSKNSQFPANKINSRYATKIVNAGMYGQIKIEYKNK